MKTNLWKLIVGFGIAAVVLGATLPDPYTSYNDNLVVRTNATVRNALKFGTFTNEWSTSSGTNLTVSGATYPSFVQATNTLGVTTTGLAVMQAADKTAGRAAIDAQLTNNWVGSSNNSLLAGEALMQGATVSNSWIKAGTYFGDTTNFPNTLVIGTGGSSISTNAPYPVGDPTGAMAGQFNTFLGIDAGFYQTTAHGNTLVGTRAGLHDTIGEQNTYVGWAAGENTVGGYHNTYIGVGAGQDDISGIHNVYVGCDAGLAATNGSYNVAVGSSSGNNIIGTNNAVLGYAAGRALHSDNNVFIGSNAGLSATNALNNVGVGFQALNASETGYNTAVGYWSGLLTTTGGSNTFLGSFAGVNNDTGGRNVLIGYSAGGALTNSSDNVIIGVQAGDITKAGNSDTLVGYHAAHSNSSGSKLVAMGYGALENNTTGNNNTAIGAQSLDQNQTGADNTAVGLQALFHASGSRNTGLGVAAGTTLTSGADNTFIGEASNVLSTSSTNLNNATAIGAGAVVTNSNQIVFGSPSVTDQFANGAFRASGGIGSYGVGTVTTSDTGATNTLTVNVVLYVTAATAAALTDNAGTTEFSGVTIASFTPIRLQPGGKFTGTSITYATGTASHAW